MGVTQLFFQRARSLEEIQAFVLMTNANNPPTNKNTRLWGHPIKDDNFWVITWYETVDIDMEDQLRDEIESLIERTDGQSEEIPGVI